MDTRLWLVCFGLFGQLGCAVEDVFVDTGDGDTAGDGAPDKVPRTRPDDGDAGPDPDVPDDPDPDEPLAELILTPERVGAGSTVVFVDSSSEDLDDVSDVLLYGEPDATLETWATDGPSRLVLVVDVAPTSPLGELLVVIEHADGEVSRPEAPLLVE